MYAKFIDEKKQAGAVWLYITIFTLVLLTLTLLTGCLSGNDGTHYRSGVTGNDSSADTGDKEGVDSAYAGDTENSSSHNESDDSNLEAGGAANVEYAVQYPDVNRMPRVIDNKYGVYYEIFVRSFADSNGDGIGDINGLISKLDYLNDGNKETDTDLGINGIYLMPVNKSPSYHKYDVTDYYDIDPEYGTLEDFEHFIAEAHRRGIKVIMDLVINHTSSQHPWFKESAASAGSPYRGYYNWADENTQGYNIKSLLSSGSKIWHELNGSYYYGYFWDGMPDLNFDSSDVRQEVKDIARFWLEKGVDGFRLDAAMHIYGIYEKPVGTKLQEKNLQWWREFGAAAEEVKADVYLVGEVWEKTYAIAPYYEGLDTLFNFDLGEGIITTVRTGTATAVSSKGFSQWLSAKYDMYGKAEKNYLDGPFLTNHDQNRIMDRLGRDVDKAKLSASIYLTLPGNPFIYYGEEIGMTGMKPDEMIRVPFIWFEETKLPQCTWESTLNNTVTVPEEIQRNDPDSLLNHYKRLIRVRQSSEALMKGSFEPAETNNRAVVAYERIWICQTEAATEDRVVVMHNVSDKEQKISLDISLSGSVVIFDSTDPDGLSHEAGKSGDRSVGIIGSGIVMPPLSTIIIDLE